MSGIEETKLPGVGVRRDFVTKRGDRIGVIAYHTGRRELLIYDRRDPDACRETLRLDDDDSRTLAELLGGMEVRQGAAPAPVRGDGFVIDWTRVDIAFACAGRTLAEAVAPAGVGASVAAIVRRGEVVPTPPADFRIEPGDTAVLIGTADGIRRLEEALRRG